MTAVNGCFDVLHAGHIHLLRAAALAGYPIIVGLNDDESVRKLKGECRPINGIGDRIAVIESLRMVDHVCVFSGPIAVDFLDAVMPALWIKGSDYTKYTVNRMEYKAVKACGGIVRFIELLLGRSTTKILTQNKT